MDELVKMVVQRTGLPEDQARDVVTMVVGFIKQRLPAPIAAQVDGLLDGNVSSDDVQNALGGLGGLFGKKEP